MKRWAGAAGWVLLAGPGLWQLGLLVIAIAGRFGYPYDLEWMEGGILHGAWRIERGEGLYPPPSIDFIPFLYTPLYPGVVAALGSIAGITYQLGRALSIAALLGLGGVVVGQAAALPARVRAPAAAGAALALGLFAAAYPFVDGWYDLVRADTLFLFMITGAIYATHRWIDARDGTWIHARIAGIGAVLGLAFFAKQTGVVFALAAGPIALVGNWRRALTLGAAAGVVGLGGTALLNYATGGWFWTYVREVHQLHDWNLDRFWRSFDLILTQFPIATAIIAVALVATAIAGVRRRRLPPSARAFLLWTYCYAVSTLVGAIGWGTEFAHFNAYMPALLHGAIAAGLAVPALAELGIEWFGPRARVRAPAALAAVALGVALIQARWEPRRFVPTAADRAAGDRLVATLRERDGEVWIPSHPWYAHLAGKTPYVHRMGIKDVTRLRTPPNSVGDLLTSRFPIDAEVIEPELRRHRFAAVILDNRDVHLDGGWLAAHYRAEERLPRDARPQVYSGARVTPESVWVPALPTTPPAEARALFDFEDRRLDGWTLTGSAWGGSTEPSELAGQGMVLRFGGRRFATSFHGGDHAIGTLLSPKFELDGARMSMRLGGGADSPRLRVELRIAGKPVRTASPPAPSSELFSDVVWDIADLRGQTAELAVIDDERGGWGHLNLDEVWLWR